MQVLICKKGTVADATELTNIAFEEIKYPQQILSLFSTISGWEKYSVV
jgi:hypothetical protein